MDSIKGQLTLRGVLVGVIGCVVITASSAYVALRLGALPWPIAFAAILSFLVLRCMTRGKASLNEINVTHTVMSSGAMVAGGLAFTIPGAWMLGLADGMSMLQLMAIALCGSAMGLVGSVALRRHFICDVGLEYPIGDAAARTLMAGDRGTASAAKLFAAMGASGLYTMLRDGLALLPTIFCQSSIAGVSLGVYNSPMMLAVGFLVGGRMVIVWFAGALLANFGIIVGGSAVGWWDAGLAQQIVSSLGMGCMMGCGIAIIVKDIIPKAVSTLRGHGRGGRDEHGRGHRCGPEHEGERRRVGERERGCGCARTHDVSRRALVAGAFVMAASALVVCIVLEMPLWVSVLVVACAFVACAMSAQSSGQTGIDPMEIFGLLALLLVAALAQVGQLQLFFVAALVAVACGLAGDVMNDFKAGHVLGTSPKAQWVGQAIGAAVGSVVAVAVLQLLLGAYGADAFGAGKEFVSVQASVVASLVQGVPSPAAFWVGIAAGLLLYLLRFPSMMLGLGIYLPFYMSITAFLGALAKMAWDAAAKARCKGRSSDDARSILDESEESGLLIASGVLGGESIVGIVFAIVVSSALLTV